MTKSVNAQGLAIFRTFFSATLPDGKVFTRTKSYQTRKYPDAQLRAFTDFRIAETEYRRELARVQRALESEKSDSLIRMHASVSDLFTQNESI